MQKALDAAQREEMGWLRASNQEFNVPQVTLRRRARKKNKYVDATNKGGKTQKRIDKKYGVSSKIREDWEMLISLMMTLSQLS